MSRIILTSEAACQDIKNAKSWYEQQRVGLSFDFELCLESGYDDIQNKPEAFQVKYKSVRVRYIPRFPYGIHYIIGNDFIYVIAVFDTYESPLKWVKRK